MLIYDWIKIWLIESKDMTKYTSKIAKEKREMWASVRPQWPGVPCPYKIWVCSNSSPDCFQGRYIYSRNQYGFSTFPPCRDPPPLPKGRKTSGWVLQGEKASQFKGLICSEPACLLLFKKMSSLPPWRCWNLLSGLSTTVLLLEERHQVELNSCADKVEKKTFHTLKGLERQMLLEQDLQAGALWIC